MTVKKILAQRQKTHGSFTTHAQISQHLKNVMRVYGLDNLDAYQIEALEMIAHKIARILNGNPNYRDHWDDIAGYATLVAEEL